MTERLRAVHARSALEARPRPKGIRSRGPFFQTEIKAHCRGLSIARGADPLRRVEPRTSVAVRSASRCPTCGRLFRGGASSGALMSSGGLVVTSIAAPTPALEQLAESAAGAGIDFILIGDAAEPSRLRAAGLRLLRARAAEIDSGLRLADDLPGRALRAQERRLPDRHGARRRDDRRDRRRHRRLRRVLAAARVDRDGRPSSSLPAGSTSTRYFSDCDDLAARSAARRRRARVSRPRESLPRAEVDCPIQQGLVDDDPDVDAIYRLLLELPFRFEPGPSVALDAGCLVPVQQPEHDAGGPRPFRSCTCRPTARSG